MEADVQIQKETGKGLKVQQEKMKWFRRAREIGKDRGQT